MALQSSLSFRCLIYCPTEAMHFQLPPPPACSLPSITRTPNKLNFSSTSKRSLKLKMSASKAVELMLGGSRDDDDDDDDDSDSDRDNEKKNNGHDPFLMTDVERAEMRRKIREVIEAHPEVDEETDPVQRKIKMEKLLKDYPLVVEEDDPDWPEDADGWGFKFGQFFDKITIKNNKKDDDEDYDSQNEIVWKDDNYIKAVRDITTSEWEDTVFKDFNPLVILVHNRYKRPKENENARIELEKAIEMFWNTGLPSPRCVAVDAVVEDDLAAALGVTKFPEILFTKAGKILHRDQVVRTADEWSKIMAFFYYKAVRPSCLEKTVGEKQEKIPSL